jgi:hypothetical protein
MRFWLLPFNVSCVRLCSHKLLLLLLWSLLLVSVSLIQVFQVAWPQVLLAVSLNLLWFAGNVLSSARLAGALLRVELLHARS